MATEEPTAPPVVDFEAERRLSHMRLLTTLNVVVTIINVCLLLYHFFSKGSP